MNIIESTFKDLFKVPFNQDNSEIFIKKIEIPIIQRDYAQGRKNVDIDRIRDDFLSSLLKAVSNKEKLVLDFVYGDISEEGVLTPLDGQQRLTTLFLLYWYSAKKEEIDPKEYDFLNNFTYATRTSSREFRKKLIAYNPDFKKNISEEIKDQPWYPYQWDNDPTIQSMLVMINAINEKFKDQTNIWDSLKLLAFHFLPLREMGLNDDLYIKMNSRGKPLTPFEHFKAEFEEIIRQHSEELSGEINHKLDRDWTDLLFPYRSKDKNIIDEIFMRYFFFVSDILIQKYGLNFEKDEFKLTHLLYGINAENAIGNINYLKNSFDCWDKLTDKKEEKKTAIKDFFNKYFTNNKYETGKVCLYQEELDIFKECCDNYDKDFVRIRNFPLNKILLLFSINTYLQNKENIRENEFIRRIRIIRNLILNSTDEIRDERMQTLLKESETIIMYGEIPTSDKGELGYNTNQKEEENRKINWLKNNPKMADELFHLEDHHLLKGCISIVDWDQNENFNKFRLLFDNCEKDLINRVLLSIDDYSQKISWRHQIGAKSQESVWNDLFTKKRNGFENTKKIINTLLSNLIESEINNETLENRISLYLKDNNTKKDWKYYFIKYEDMREGKYGMYYWENRKEKPYEIIMMNTEKSMNGKNWNVFLFTLSKLINNNKLLLSDYANQDNSLTVGSSNISVKSLNDMYVIYKDNTETEKQIINQRDGIDVEDRIEKGIEIIKNILSKEE